MTVIRGAAARSLMALVGDALTSPGPVTLRLSWTATRSLLVEVTERAPVAALLAADSDDRQDLRTRGAAATVEHLADAWGLRRPSPGTCVWARMSGRSAC